MTRCFGMKLSRVIALLVLALGGACSRPGGHIAATQLLGRWEAQFSSHANDRPVIGTIVLDSLVPVSAACRGAGDVCTEAVGTHTVDFRPLLGHALPSEVAVASDSDGAIYLVVGTCCDRGELELKGRPKSGEIRGSWEETRISIGRSGSFVLKRSK